MPSGPLVAYVDAASEVALRLAGSRPYERSFALEIVDFLTHGSARRARLIGGPRRVGKSVGLQQALARLRAQGAPVWLCDFSVPAVGRPGALLEVAEAMSDRGRHAAMLLLDEVHYVGDSWSRELKVAVDRGLARIVIADSCMARIQKSAREDLLGRIDPVVVHPLSFTEWIDLRAATGIAPPSAGDELREAAARYRTVGGFPELALAEGITEAHRRLRDDVAMRAVSEDVAFLHGARHPAGLRRLLDSLLASSGAQHSVKDAATVAGTTHVTLPTWVQQLEDTGLVWELPRRVKSIGKHGRAAPKIYAVDPGLVAACSMGILGPSPDFGVHGGQVETVVAQTLRRSVARTPGASLTYARSPDGKSEIDFVVETQDAPPRAFEVTAGDTSGKPASIVRAARALDLDDAWLAVVSPRVRRADVVRHDGANVRLLPLHEFLLAVDRLPTEALPWP